MLAVSCKVAARFALAKGICYVRHFNSKVLTNRTCCVSYAPGLTCLSPCKVIQITGAKRMMFQPFSHPSRYQQQQFEMKIVVRTELKHVRVDTTMNEMLFMQTCESISTLQILAVS